MPELTQSRLKELLHYNPDDGVFTWLNRPIGSFITDRAGKTWNGKFAGKAAGTLQQNGYISMAVHSKQCRAHRLAYLYMTGAWPIEIDHDDRVRHHNWWSNLNNGTSQDNNRNHPMKNTNTSGTTGVGWHKASKKWHAYISADGKEKGLGYYAYINDAIAARKAAEIKYGYHKNHGIT
ncbi:HNH endonuclease [Candidatus Pacearchaeota archaeon]|nr:HNH endonuclease [Candidatus Pacearchaeota archaeon]